MDVGELLQRGVLDFLVGVQQTCGRVGEEVHNVFSWVEAAWP